MLASMFKFSILAVVWSILGGGHFGFEQMTCIASLLCNKDFSVPYSLVFAHAGMFTCTLGLLCATGGSVTLPIFGVAVLTVTNFTDVGRFSIDFKWFAGPFCCEGGMMSGSEVGQSLPFADIVSVSEGGLEMVDVGFLQDMMYLVLLGSLGV